MTEEWLLVYQVRWYAWVFLSLYDVIVESFMAILGLGGLGFGIAALFGLVSMPFNKTMPTWQSYGIFFVELLFAAWIGWNGLRGMWAELLAIFTPPLMFQGTLEQITTEMQMGRNIEYPVRVLKFADKTWEIYERDFDRGSHTWQVMAGREVRIQYRRGTEQITELSVKSKDGRTRRN